MSALLSASARPRRLAFVGQSTYFEACAMQPGTTSHLHVGFHEYRAGADVDPLLDALAEFDADVVLVFRPEIVPHGALDGVRAATLGFLTEPLPRADSGGVPHPDLMVRLAELEEVDAGNFDRVVSFDPLIATTASRILPVWRAVPLPVADRFFRRVRPPDRWAQPLFVGRSTEHRERVLELAKHGFDLFHVAFGIDAERLEALLDAHWVAINIHNEPYPSFENRVCLHLAAGHLVLTEPLSPRHGLEPDIDVLEFEGPEQLERMLAALRDAPDLWHAVRVRGRRKAEQFRASRVYPRLVDDLLADLRAFGSPRR